MALGGGAFVSQNKVLPGAYINFISAASASSALGERGIVAMPLELDWGLDGKIFYITREDFQRKSKELLGYDATHPKLKGLRDLFLNAHTLISYKLSSGGVKASNQFAEAIHGGTRGNDLKIQIQESVDVVGEFVVKTLLDNVVVDEQIVININQLQKNAFVEFKTDATLSAQAGVPLTGGANGEIDGAKHQEFLDRLESHTFNTLGTALEDETINNLYAQYTRRMRDERGQKFQAVLFNTPADYEGVINVKNKVLDDENKGSLVFWVTGLIAGTSVNQSALNRLYEGEYDVEVEFTQVELEQAIRAGEFVIHQVGQEYRVLYDINSLVTLNEEKGSIFQDNQTIRVIDQIANDIAILFSEKYLGLVPNDKSGQISLQSDIIQHHQELQNIGAISNFSEDDVSVVQGDDKKSVLVSDQVEIINTQEKLYMGVLVV